MEAERLEQELRDFFAVEVHQAEPPVEWWNKIVAGLEDRKRGSFWQRFMPKTRLAWALALLTLLVIGGTAYAATFVVRELFLNYAGHIEEAGLAWELNLSQTVGDITVRLERAYADANVVLTGFTVSGPEDRYFTRGGTLTTDDGQILPAMFGMGVVPGSEIVMGGWRPDERTAVMAAFNASPISGEPLSISLRLDIQVSESPLPGESQASFGPFVFYFDVPFNTAKTVIVEQTADAADTAITLEKVAITPWATKVVFRFPPGEDTRGTPIISLISLELPDGSREMESFGHTSAGSIPEYRSYFTGDFAGQRGRWTITIRELILPPDLSEMTEVEGYEGKVLIGKGNDDNRLAGPWIFSFDVP